MKLKKKIKILCTLGPSSLNKGFLKFSKKNVSLLRLNMSHTRLNNLEKQIKFIKKYTNTPICIDTEGAQIRTTKTSGKIKIKNDARKHGVSKYKAFRYQGAFDLLSLLFTIKHSFTPLHFFGPVSLLFFIPGLLVFSYLVLSHIFALGFQDYDILVSRPLLDMSLTTMLAGLIILMTGFVCDFILYHHLRFNSRMITENTVVEIIGSKRKK